MAREAAADVNANLAEKGKQNMVRKPSQLIKGGAASFLAVALTASMAPTVALAASTEADAQGTVVAEADAGETAQTASHTASVTDITDTSAKITVNESLGDFDLTAKGSLIIKTYLIEKAGEAAPEDGAGLYDKASNVGLADDDEDKDKDVIGGIETSRYRSGNLTTNTIPENWVSTGLEPGTDYVVYSTVRYTARDENGDSETLYTPVVATAFTTTGVGVDSVTHEISALVTGGFDAEAVAAARADYNALSEEQQAQVANADVLTAAEAVVSARAEAAQAKSDADAAKTAQKEAEEAQAKAEKALSDYQAAHPAVQANTMTARAAKKTVKAKALKKKAQQVKIVVGKAQGKVTYKKAKKSGIYKKAAVSKKGVVTLKKGAKKGTYKFKVTAAGDASHSAKTVTVSIKVK